jgi:predicted phosphodiesterase
MSEAVDQHTIISAVIELAQELGRTPTRQEFENKIRGGKYQLGKLFGGQFAVLLQAAGLEPSENSRVKITNDIFKRDIAKHLESYEPRPVISGEKYQRVLFVPDTHFPFAHMPTLEKIYRFIEKEKPEVVVQVGDLYDAYSHAKFPRSHNVFTPRDEQAKARAMADEFWSEISRIVPLARKVQLCGNHDVRALKRILEVYPSAEDWIAEKLKELMSFEGVETIFDTRQELMLPGDVMVIHGYRGKIGEHRDHALYNAVCGHQHVGGAVFRQIRGRVLWELNCGLAGDPLSKGMSYTPQRITNWTLGFGWLDEHGPRFIPTGA